MKAEDAVIGSILVDSECIYEISDIPVEAFESEKTRAVWQAALGLVEKGVKVDLVTLKDATGFMPTELLEYSNQIATTSNIVAHANIVKRNYRAKRLKEIASEVQLSEDDPDQLSSKVLDAVFELSDDSSSTEKASDVAIQMFSDYKEGRKGIPTGFKLLDHITGGWHNTDLIILAARPGMGKTSLAMSYAMKAAKEGKKVGFFSLEMGKQQLSTRLISMLSGISSNDIKNGKVKDHEWEAVHEAIERLSELEIYIDDSAAITPAQLIARSKRMKVKHGIEMIFLDYLQLMSTTNRSGSRNDAVSEFSRSAKLVAKELNVPVIALSQLSRAVETRGGDKRPMLSDLRDSGAIEQDADIVQFIYRPDYYELEETELDKGKTEIIMAKHRNGSLGTVDCFFDSARTLFIDRSEAPQQKDTNDNDIMSSARPEISDSDIMEGFEDPTVPF